ncbi:MAG: G1 family endopeptidase [Patescibacteria group bacterium]|nr:G1 family endopeptidase [Patescibacteria group bacterium]
MFLSFLSSWKALLVGVSTLAISTTPSPIIINAANNPNAPEISINTSTSRNWSGYAATGNQFTNVSGTWTVPNPTVDNHTTVDATWVGIGGIRTRDLIQVGTQNVVSSNNQIYSTAFYETLPNVSQPIPVAVKPGDLVSASLTQAGDGQWQIHFHNNSTGQDYLKTIDYNSSLASAEWIEEAPSSGYTTLPLDNFGSVQFSNCSTNLGSLQQNNPQTITMINSAGQALATSTSVGSDGTSFSINRSSAISVSPNSEFDRNPQEFHRRGVSVGQYGENPPTERVENQHLDVNDTRAPYTWRFFHR